MSIGSINSSLVGIQRGLQNLDQAAQATASTSVNGGPNLDTLVESSVQAKAAATQVKASIAMLKAADELQGALLDVLA